MRRIRVHAPISIGTDIVFTELRMNENSINFRMGWANVIED